MIIRSRREVVTFNHPFGIRGVYRQLPAGAYEVVTDEEMIESLSFAAFRRVATMIKVPAEGSRGLTMEVVSIVPVDLSDAQRIDASIGWLMNPSTRQPSQKTAAARFSHLTSKNHLAQLESIRVGSRFQLGRTSLDGIARAVATYLSRADCNPSTE